MKTLKSALHWPEVFGAGRSFLESRRFHGELGRELGLTFVCLLIQFFGKGIGKDVEFFVFLLVMLHINRRFLPVLLAVLAVRGLLARLAAAAFRRLGRLPHATRAIVSLAGICRGCLGLCGRGTFVADVVDLCRQALCKCVDVGLGVLKLDGEEIVELKTCTPRLVTFEPGFSYQRQLMCSPFQKSNATLAGEVVQRGSAESLLP